MTPSSKKHSSAQPPPLVLIPTRLERNRLQSHGVSGHLIGLGPIAAAATTARLLHTYQPASVLVLGIAGSLDLDAFPIGSATEFGEFFCAGIGAGHGDEHKSPSTLGWSELHGSQDGAPDPEHLHGQQAGPGLVSVCSASAHDLDAHRVRSQFPRAVGEDMETFAVAWACAQAGIPLRCIRGASNPVGDREPEHWQVAEALQSVARSVLETYPDLRSPTP